MDYTILVHTFEKYSFLWEGMQESWSDHFIRMPLIGTDVEGTALNHPFKAIYSGPGEWSDRLLALLTQIDTDTVFYIQEDMWPTKRIDFDIFYKIFKGNDLFRLQLSPITQYYTIYGDSLPLYFWEQPKSKYLTNHQPAFWNKKYLISCLEKAENPWDNEYKSTCRIWETPARVRRKLAIYPIDWFRHVYQKGKMLV